MAQSVLSAQRNTSTAASYITIFDTAESVGILRGSTLVKMLLAILRQSTRNAHGKGSLTRRDLTFMQKIETCQFCTLG